jgi:hypothetical protein
MKKALCSLCLCLLMLMACSPQQVVRPPEFIKVQDVELLELTENAAMVRVRILFRNINPMGCTVEDITFSTFIDGQPLGASRTQGTVSMNANKPFELILDTRLLLEAVPRVLLSVFGKPEVEVEVKGHATLVTAVRNFTFSFNPKNKVGVKNGLKNLIRLKLF